MKISNGLGISSGLKKNINLRSAIIFCLLIIFALAPSFAFAVDAWGLPNKPAGLSNTDLGGIVINITNYILGFITIVAVLMLIWGGIRYLTAVGDESAVEEAKNIIMQAIIGLIIVGISYSIVVVVVGWMD